MTREQHKRALIKRIESDIINRVLVNGGRWCDLNMKNGDKLRVSRTGYSSYGDFDRDICELIDLSDHTTLKEGKTPYDLAVYIHEHYCNKETTTLKDQKVV